MTYGPAYDFPFAQLVAVATLLGLLLTRDRKPMVWTREIALVAILFAYFTVTSFFAWAPTYAWSKWNDVAKILLMAAIVPLLIYGPTRIRWLLLVVALSIGFFGIKGGIFTILTGGSFTILGPRGGGFISTNTYIALAFVMTGPLLVALARSEPNTWLRRALYAAGALTLFSVPFTYSRGALIGLVCVVGLMFLRARAKLVLLVVAIPLAIYGEDLIPERLAERTATLEDPKADESAQLRWQAWMVNLNIARERPFTGAGFNLEYTSDDHWLSYTDIRVRDGDPEINYARAAHSMYFQLLGSHGFIALGLFIALLVSTLFRLQSIKRRADRLAEGFALSAYAGGIQVGLIGYCIVGAGINVAYFDLMYMYVALSAVLWRELKRLEEGGREVKRGFGTITAGAVPPIWSTGGKRPQVPCEDAPSKHLAR
jgi:probable O-glycosylation ligase (exosortase A-associated)